MEFIFSFPMRVRDYECDIQGIVNNANYLHYFEVCRHEYIESRGVEFADLHRRGIDVVVAQAEIKFKRSLRPRDRFEVRLAIEKHGLRYVFHQDIVRSADEARAATDASYAKDQLCIRAQTDIVAIIDGRLSDCAELNEKIWTLSTKTFLHPLARFPFPFEAQKARFHRRAKPFPFAQPLLSVRRGAFS